MLINFLLSLLAECIAGHDFATWCLCMYCKSCTQVDGCLLLLCCWYACILLLFCRACTVVGTPHISAAWPLTYAGHHTEDSRMCLNLSS